MTIAEYLANSEATRGTRKARQELDNRLPVGVELKDGEGYVTVEVKEQPRDESWDWIIDHHPAVSRDTHEIDESIPVEIGSWEMGFVNASGEADSKTLYRYKAKVKTRRPGERLASAKVDELVKLVRKRKPTTPPEETTEPWLAAFVSDVQLGKGEGGGTPATLERVAASLEALSKRAKKQKPAGILLAEMGDILEGCYGFYPGQQWLVDLNYTEQLNLSTEMMLSAVDAVAPYTPKVVVTFVPSNHSEIRSSKGNPITDKARDNFDLVIADNVARVLSANPERYGHVTVVRPVLSGGDPYVVTVDLDGTMVGMSHGHQISGGAANRMAGIEKYWMSHQWSDSARPGHETAPSIADCDILVVGHGHHFLMSQGTGKLAIQCPALDGGSESFTAGTGRRSSSGLLAFDVSKNWAMQANNFEIL